MSRLCPYLAQSAPNENRQEQQVHCEHDQRHGQIAGALNRHGRPLLPKRDHAIERVVVADSDREGSDRPHNEPRPRSEQR